MKSTWKAINWLAPLSLAALLVAGCQQTSSKQSDHETRLATLLPSDEQAATSKKGSAEIKTPLIHVTKTGLAEASIGDQVCYNYVITAREEIGDILISDQIPAGATYVSSDPPAEVKGVDVVWKIEHMAKGETRNAKICIRADKEGELASCFSVLANPKACISLMIGKPKLTITKTGPETALLGAEINYAITIANTGTSVAKNVVLVDEPGEGLEIRVEREKYTVPLGDFVPGQTRTINLPFRTTKRGKVCNVVKLSSANAGKAQAEACTLVAQPGLKVTKTGDKDKLFGQRASYKIVVKNTGDTDLANIVVTDEAPAATSLVSAAGANVSGNVAVWNIPSLKAGAEQSFDVVLTSRTAGSHCNKVTVVSGQLRDSAEACTAWRGVSAVLTEMVDDPDPIAVGETTTFTGTITNQGTDDVDHVNVKVLVPAGLEVVSVSNGGVISGKTITFPEVSAIAVKSKVVYTWVSKATAVGDQRTKMEVTTRIRQVPIVEEESTTVYAQ